MRTLKRSECAILPLVLKGKWYDLIASGKKREEYRDAKPYWHKRIARWLSNQGSDWNSLPTNKWLIIGFSRGYRKSDMFFLLHRHDRISHAEHPEWGEPETEHYVLGLGERVKIED